MQRWRLLLLVAALCGAAPVRAQAVGAAEHELLARERRLVTERYAAEESACRERFVVTSCVDAVRARRREAMAPLRERELALDDAERRQRALDRVASVRARQSQPDPQPAPVPQARTRPAPLPAAPVPQRHDDAGARAEAAARRAEATTRRQTVLRDEQEKVAARIARRASEGHPAAPLPRPEAAPLPRPEAASTGNR
jgi:hypothetical protein